MHPVLEQHPMVAMAAAAAAAQAAAAAEARPDSRRVRRRRPAARRSLLNLFDAAAASEEQSELSDASDSDCDMLSSQGSDQSSISVAALASPATPSPATPPHPHILLGATPSPAPAPIACTGSPAATPPLPGGRPWSSAAAAAAAPAAPSAGELLLPLQHLLMSKRAQHLTTLEVKAIVFKVAADLAAMHDGGVLHRHVTIASVALNRSGNLATARLMGHPYNVDAGQGRRYTGGKKAGVDAYLAPELARCPGDCVAYTPAGDLWALGVVLFVLLSGSHVPFGNRGLCWTSIPNMPGPQESVDKLQRWLEEHLVCKLSVINQLKQNQEKGKAAVGAGPEMRVVGLDDLACDLLLRLLAADPAARPTARQVLAHPWLAEMQGLASGAAPASAHPAEEAPAAAAAAGASAFGGPTSPEFDAKLRRAASDLACLGFSPATPPEELMQGLHRHSSNLSSSDVFYDCPPSGGASGASSAHPSSACLAEAPEVPAGMGLLQQQLLPRLQQPGPGPATDGLLTGAPAAQPAQSFVLGDGTSLQLLSAQAVAMLAAGGVLPDLGCPSMGLPGSGQPLGYAVQPVEMVVEGRRMQVSALHAVYMVDGQPMLCAQPVAVTQHIPAGGPHSALPSRPASRPPLAPVAPAAVAAASGNPDYNTSAPILPLLARMLQQQGQ